VALQKLGVAFGQGYLLARPAPLPLPSVLGLWNTASIGRPDEPVFLASPAVRSSERLEALKRAELLDSGDEETFDHFTRLVAKLLRVPTALVSLVDDRRQYFKSATGLAEPWRTKRETPLSHSFCQHAVTTRVPLIIADARIHPLVRDNGAVTELGVVAYAGVPIITSDDYALGALCAVDGTAREWTTEEIEILQDLAALLVARIELRRLQRERRDRDALLHDIVQQTQNALVLCDVEGRIELTSPRFREFSGYTEDELRGRSLLALGHPDDARAELAVRSELLSGRQAQVEAKKRILRKNGDWLETATIASVVRAPSGEARFMITTVEAVSAAPP
jgi:PAS domain S-box-containing protein